MLAKLAVFGRFDRACLRGSSERRFLAVRGGSLPSAFSVATLEATGLAVLSTQNAVSLQIEGAVEYYLIAELISVGLAALRICVFAPPGERHVLAMYQFPRSRS